MTDIHEEAQFGLTHLLGMDMCLKAQTVLLTMVTIGEELPGEESDDEGIEEVGPCGTVPGAVHNDGETAFRSLNTTALCLHAEAVGAWWQMGEREFVVPCRQCTEGLTVDAVMEDDVLRVLIGQRREVDGERVVVVSKHEVVAGRDRGLSDLIATRARGGADRLAADGECRQLDVGIPLALLDVRGVKPGDATRASEEDGTSGIRPGGTVAELIALQTVVGKVVHHGSLVGVEGAEAMVRGYPEQAMLVTLYGGNAVRGETVFDGIVLGLLRLEIVAVESRVRTIPQSSVVLTGHPDGHAVVEAVDAKGLRPTVAGDIEAAESHRRGDIEAGTVWRERDLRDVVVGDAVHRGLVGGVLLHHVGAELSVSGVIADDTVAHGGQPEAVLSIDLDIHDDEVVVLGIINAPVLERPGVDAASPFAVGANPDAPVAGLCHGHDGRGITL